MQFKALLDRFNPADREDQLLYFRLVHELDIESMEELRPRMSKAITHRDFRLIIMETAYYHPWPEWIEPLTRVLRYESDLGVFSAGVATLQHMNQTKALDALRELGHLRHAPAFQELIAEAIAEAIDDHDAVVEPTVSEHPATVECSSTRGSA